MNPEIVALEYAFQQLKNAKGMGKMAFADGFLATLYQAIVSFDERLTALEGKSDA